MSGTIDGREPSLGNPLLEEFIGLDAQDRAAAATRDRLIARYGFAIPTDDVLRHIHDLSPAGIVEIGAGTGYWARLLRDQGTPVLAYDREPPPSAASNWFAGSSTWHPVERGDETVADAAPPATLLLVWPTRDETWSTTAAQHFHTAGGTVLVFVGEGPGGRTGDDTFHAVLGELRHCNQCTYGVTSAACICGITPLWRRSAELPIPNWPSHHDTVRIYHRTEPKARSTRRRLNPRWVPRRS